MRTFEEALALYNPSGEISELDKANVLSDKQTFTATEGWHSVVRLMVNETAHNLGLSSAAHVKEIYGTVCACLHMGIDIGRLMEREDLDETSLQRAATPGPRETTERTDQKYSSTKGEQKA